MNGRGNGTTASFGGLVATTDGADTGFSTSTWLDWLIRTRPSSVVITTSPRLPPRASATLRNVATSTIVSSLPAAASPTSEIGPALCETNSKPSSGVPILPNASESMSESNSSIFSARA